MTGSENCLRWWRQRISSRCAHQHYRRGGEPLFACEGARAVRRGKHDAFHVARQLGRDAAETEFMGYGLNHATWSTHFAMGVGTA